MMRQWIVVFILMIAAASERLALAQNTNESWSNNISVGGFTVPDHVEKFNKGVAQYAQNFNGANSQNSGMTMHEWAQKINDLAAALHNIQSDLGELPHHMSSLTTEQKVALVNNGIKMDAHFALLYVRPTDVAHVGVEEKNKFEQLLVAYQKVMRQTSPLMLDLLNAKSTHGTYYFDWVHPTQDAPQADVRTVPATNPKSDPQKFMVDFENDIRQAAENKMIMEHWQTKKSKTDSDLMDMADDLREYARSVNKIKDDLALLLQLQSFDLFDAQQRSKLTGDCKLIENSISVKHYMVPMDIGQVPPPASDFKAMERWQRSYFIMLSREAAQTAYAKATGGMEELTSRLSQALGESSR